jgi:WD40 repeat protein/tRNA A-37 threonylcarbamoyl transferase component Bud32
MADTTPDQSREERINGVIADYLDAVQAGQKPDPREVLARHPDLAAELRTFFAAHRDVVGDVQPAERFGDYEILEEIGRGGMGVVYKARHVTLHRLAALKMILAGAFAGEQERRRFLTEAAALARLEHPHVVHLYEFGERGGQPWFALEFVEGGSLAQKLGGTPQPPRQAAEIVEKLARGIHAAHQQGIVHRDLKPANVLLAADGTPKITDFGLAKLREVEPGAMDANCRTASGSVLGTPSYMAPEQAEGKVQAIGPAADVYALGVILYEILTGRPPFRAPTLRETLNQVVHAEPVPPRRLQSGVPRDLDTICLKCLRKETGQRYAGALALAEDLRRFLDGEPIKARPTPHWERALKWVRRRPGTAAAWGFVSVAVLVLFLGSSQYYAYRQVAQADLRAAEERREAEVAEERKRAGVQEYYALVTGAWEKRIAGQAGSVFAALDDLARAARIDTPARNPVELRRAVAQCFAQVDVREKTSWKMPRGLGLFQVQADRLAFSPDGKRLAIAQQRGTVRRYVLVVDVSSGKEVATLTYGGPAAIDAAGTGGGALAFSPDGRWLVLGTGQGEIYAWDARRLDGAEAASWIAHQKCVTGLAFPPQDRVLLSCSEDGWLKCWTTPDEEPPARLARWPARQPAQRCDWSFHSLTVSGDGRELRCCTSAGIVTEYLKEFLDHNTPLSRPVGLKKDLVDAVCISPNLGSLWASTENQCPVLVHNDSARVLQDPRLGNVGHEEGDIRLGFSPDGAHLLSSSGDKTIKIWDVATGRLLVTTRAAAAETGGGTPHVAICPDGVHLAATDGPRAVLYEVLGPQVHTTLACYGREIQAFDLAPDGRSAACVAEDHDSAGREQDVVTLWDVASGRKAGSFPVGDWLGKARGCVVYHPGGTLLAFTHSPRDVHLWDPGAPKAGKKVTLAKTSAALAFARDGQSLWAVADDELISWRLSDPGARSTTWRNQAGRILTGVGGLTSVAAGNEWVVAGSDDGAVKLFRIGDGSRLAASWPVTGGPVTSVALSPDETLAVAGTRGGKVHVLRLPGGEPVRDLADHHDRVTSVAFGQGGLLATASADRTIRLWRRDGDSLEELLTLPATGEVAAVRFSSDGSSLAVLVRREAGVRLWHLDRLRARLEALGLGW